MFGVKESVRSLFSFLIYTEKCSDIFKQIDSQSQGTVNLLAFRVDFVCLVDCLFLALRCCFSFTI